MLRVKFQLWIADFDEIWHECSLQKNYSTPTYFFLSTMVDAEGAETTLKVEGAKHVLSNISEIMKDNNFCANWWN